MKILVPVKRVVDYNVKIRVKSDGSGVELANVKMSMNPFDEIAVEEAIRLKEKGKATEIVVVSIGPAQAAETIRTALAMGADRGILVKADGDRRAARGRQDPQGHRRAGEARPRHPRQAGDRRRLQPDRPDAGRADRLAAGHLRVQARDRRRQHAGDARGRRRLADREAEAPAIVTTDLRLNEPRYASLPNIMKAKKKPIEEKTPDAYGVDVAPRLEVLKTTEPPGRKAGVKVKTVAELVDKLKNEAGVI